MKFYFIFFLLSTFATKISPKSISESISLQYGDDTISSIASDSSGYNSYSPDTSTSTDYGDASTSSSADYGEQTTSSSADYGEKSSSEDTSSSEDYGSPPSSTDNYSPTDESNTKRKGNLEKTINKVSKILKPIMKSVSSKKTPPKNVKKATPKHVKKATPKHVKKTTPKHVKKTTPKHVKKATPKHVKKTTPKHVKKISRNKKPSKHLRVRL